MYRDGKNESASHTTAGISLIGFIVVVAVSLSYYQFMYVSQVNSKPTFSNSILSPQETIKVTMVEDAYLESSPIHFKPQEVRAMLGVSNKIEWTNYDTVSHTVTTDSPQYVDIVNGKFDSLAHPEQTGSNGLIKPGETWSFTFTKVGEFPYHCDPHPYMKGTVTVVENFS
jgi:plastocyanin